MERGRQRYGGPGDGGVVGGGGMMGAPPPLGQPPPGVGSGDARVPRGPPHPFVPSSDAPSTVTGPPVTAPIYASHHPPPAYHHLQLLQPTLIHPHNIPLAHPHEGLHPSAASLPPGVYSTGAYIPTTTAIPMDMSKAPKSLLVPTTGLRHPSELDDLSGKAGLRHLYSKLQAPPQAVAVPVRHPGVAPPMFPYHHSAGGGGAVALAAPPQHVLMPVHSHNPFALQSASLKEEERKRQKRALNRQSAQRCRKRKRAMLEDLIKENQEFAKHEAIMECLPGTSIEFNFWSGTITNIHGARRLGFEKGEIENGSVYDILDGPSRKRVHDLILQLLDDWETTTNESGASGSDNGATESNGSSSSSNDQKGTSSDDSGGSSRENSENHGSSSGDNGSSSGDNNSNNEEDSNSVDGTSPPRPAHTDTESTTTTNNHTATTNGEVPSSRSSSNGQEANGSSNGSGGETTPPNPAQKATQQSSDNTDRSTTAKRFTSREPGSSTNSNISQLLPYGSSGSCEFNYQVSNLRFFTKSGELVPGDVNGVVTLSPGQTAEPECIWSINFHDSQSSPSSSSSESPISSEFPGLGQDEAHGSRKLCAYSKSKISESSGSPSSEDTSGNMDSSGSASPSGSGSSSSGSEDGSDQD